MAIAEYLSSIETSRNIIRNKLVSMGLATSLDHLEALAAVIDDLINQGAVNLTVKEGDTVTIPAGFHNGNGTVSGVSGGGSYTLQAKTITPTKKQQSIGPDAGYYGLSGVLVNAIPDNYQDVSSVNTTAADVLTGKIFVAANGVVTPGEMINNGAVDRTLDVTTVSFTIPQGFHNGSGKVQIVLETKTVTPTKSRQEISATSGKVLSKFIVEAIPDNYHDVSGVTATAPHVLAGDTFVDATGTPVEGTMPNKGAVAATIDGLTTTSYVIPAGYHDGTGTVSLTDDIEKALAAI